jgi:hypothetical protein
MEEAIVELHETGSLDSRRRLGPLDHGDCGPLIWRVILASSGFGGMSQQNSLDAKSRSVKS